VSEDKNDVLTIWMPLIAGFVASAIIYIFGKNQDDTFYSEWGTRLFEPGFLEFTAILIFIVMFLVIRSSGKKTLKKKTDQ